MFAVLLVMCTQMRCLLRSGTHIRGGTCGGRRTTPSTCRRPPPATEALHVVERFTRPTIGRVDIDVTTDDPKAYTKPGNVKLAWRLVPDTDLIESICEENNKDLPHMVGK